MSYIRAILLVCLVYGAGALTGCALHKAVVKAPFQNCAVIRIKGNENSTITTDPNDETWLVIRNPLAFECYDTPKPRTF